MTRRHSFICLLSQHGSRGGLPSCSELILSQPKAGFLRRRRSDTTRTKEPLVQAREGLRPERMWLMLPW